MVTIDAKTLWSVVPQVDGPRAARQREIVTGAGAFMEAELAAYQVDTPLRIANFLGQCAEESDAFCTLEEYASGAAYQGRADLGNTHPGDGVKYKGRGLIQVTGRANYDKMGTELGVDLIADPARLGADYELAVASALVFWRDHGLNAVADRDDERAITRTINGGYNGLASRLQYTARAKTAIAKAMQDQATASQAASGSPTAVSALGDSGEVVAELQRLLRDHGYPVTVDGSFGPATRLAVEHFQASHRLVADGMVGVATAAALRSAQG